jgi:hypothetical protein
VRSRFGAYGKNSSGGIRKAVKAKRRRHGGETDETDGLDEVDGGGGLW